MLKHAGETSPKDQDVLATYLIQEGGLPSPKDQEVKMRARVATGSVIYYFDGATTCTNERAVCVPVLLYLQVRVT